MSQVAPVYAGSMVGIEDAASQCSIDVEHLRQWTESGHAPHYMVNGSGPFYKISELKYWAKENLIVKKGGFPVPRTIDVLRPVHEVSSRRCPPTSIAAMQGLCYVAITCSVSGIYFLCDGDEVVYVGQSVCVAARLGQHISEGVKKFEHDRIFFLPCPVASLDIIENHYIETMNPKYNGGMNRKETA